MYTIDRRLGVRLENRDPNKTLRDVNLTLLSILPDDGYPMPMELTEGISINPGSNTLVPLVRYNEPHPNNHPTSNISGDTMMIIGFSLDDGTAGIPAGLDNVLKFRATASDTPPTEATIRVYVEDGKLRIVEMR